MGHLRLPPVAVMLNILWLVVAVAVAPAQPVEVVEQEVRAQVPDSLSLRRHIRSLLVQVVRQVQMGAIPYLVPLPQQVVARVVQQDLPEQPVLMVVLVEEGGSSSITTYGGSGNTPSVSPHKETMVLVTVALQEARTHLVVAVVPVLLAALATAHVAMAVLVPSLQFPEQQHIMRAAAEVVMITTAQRRVLEVLVVVEMEGLRVLMAQRIPAVEEVAKVERAAPVSSSFGT